MNQEKLPAYKYCNLFNSELAGNRKYVENKIKRTTVVQISIFSFNDIS